MHDSNLPIDLLELEQRVVATILDRPAAFRHLRRRLCPWCLFVDQRNALLVEQILKPRRWGFGELSRLLWRFGSTTLAAAEQYVCSLALTAGVEELGEALRVLQLARAAGEVHGS